MKKRFISRTKMVVTPDIEISNEVFRSSEQKMVCVGSFVDRKGVKVDVFEEYPEYIVVEKLSIIKIGNKKVKDFSNLPFTLIDLSQKKIQGKSPSPIKTLWFSYPKLEQQIKEIVKKYNLQNVYEGNGQYYALVGMKGVYLKSKITCDISHLNPDAFEDFEAYKNTCKEVVKDIEEAGFVPESFSKFFHKDEEYEIDWEAGEIIHKKGNGRLPIPKRWFNDETIERWQRYRNVWGKENEWYVLIGTKAYKHIKEKINEYKEKIKELQKSLQIEEHLSYYEGTIEIEGERLDSETIRIRWAEISCFGHGGCIDFSSGRHQDMTYKIEFTDEDWIEVKAPYPVVLIPNTRGFENFTYYQDNACMVVHAQKYYDVVRQEKIQELSKRVEKLQQTLAQKEVLL